MTADAFKTSTHTPAHLLSAGAYYILTGATYQHQSHLAADERKREWHHAFLFATDRYAWSVKACVVLSNHYHVIVQAPEAGAGNLPRFVASYHKFTALRWNAEDAQPGRQVWWNYWDTCLRSEAAYLVRWNYIHWNPVRHGLVVRPEDYAFSSYRQYFDAAPDEVRKIETRYSFNSVTDVPDDF